MKLSVDTTDLDRLAAVMATEPQRAQDAAYKAGITVGKRVKSAASADAPADRPWLSRSGIRHKSWRDRNGSHTDVYTAQDEHGQNVGFHVEYGTSTRPPDPFLSKQMSWAADDFAAEVMSLIDPLGGA